MKLIVLALGVRIFSVLAALTMALAVKPEVFGIYGRLQMLGLVFMVFAFLRLERAVITVSSVREAYRASLAGLIVMPIAAVITLAMAFVLLPDLSSAIRGDSVNGNAMILLLLVSLVCRALVLLLHSWLTRWSRQKAISGLIGVQALVQAVAQFGFLKSDMGALPALVAGELAGSLAAVLLGVSWDPRIIRGIRRVKHAIEVFSRQRVLPFVNMPAALMSQALVALPLLTVGHITDGETTGHLALAWRIAEAPMLLLAATATSLAVTTGIWSRRDFVADDRRKAFAYVLLIVTLAGALMLVAFTAGPVSGNARIAATAGLVPYAVFLTAGIALGGPHGDLVTFAGAERPAMAIHAMALLCGCAVHAMAEDPLSALLLFGLILLARSAALWLLLPCALKKAQRLDERNQ